MRRFELQVDDDNARKHNAEDGILTRCAKMRKLDGYEIDKVISGDLIAAGLRPWAYQFPA